MIRIYVAKGDWFNNQTADTYYTHHMDVILSPDSVGTSCNYQPSYFDLGTGRTIQGLPTMLNYNLGPVIGSICDSLSNGIKIPEHNKLFELYPNPFTDAISLHSLYSVSGKLIVRDELGKLLFEEKFSDNKTFELSFLPAGVYFLSVEINQKVFNEKVVKLK